MGNIYNGINLTLKINILTKNVYKFVMRVLKLYTSALPFVVKYISNT